VNRTLFGQIGRFVVVGAIGFAIDGSLLYLLVRNGTNPYLARGVSFPPAVTATWYLNRSWTFAAHAGSTHQQYARYITVQIAGALSNYAVYALVLLLIYQTAEKALVALAVGSATGLLVNFVGARTLVFVSTGSSRVICC
jgi:putative flippase GtrA